jgi:hypothetical protein
MAMSDDFPRWVASLDDEPVDMDAYARMLVGLKGMTWEDAQKAATEAAERYGLDARAGAVAAELVAAPRAWRIALNRYREQDKKP